jgi:hypothetical protein
MEMIGSIPARSMGEVLDTIARTIAVDDEAGRAAMDREKALATTVQHTPRMFSANDLVGLDADNEDHAIYARRCRDRW